MLYKKGYNLKISKFTHLGNSLVQLTNAIHVAIMTQSYLEMPSIGTDAETFDLLRGIPPFDFIKDNSCGISLESKFFFKDECFGLGEMSNIERREILQNYIYDNLILDDMGNVDDDTLVIHIRSGDIFGGWVHGNYVQPPLSYYKKIIKESGKEKVLLITQEDKKNPCVDGLLSWNNRVQLQTGSLSQDMTSILLAKELVIGFGTFGWMLSLMSKNINRLYTPEVNQDLFSSYFMRPPFAIKRYVFEDYINIGEWKNTKDQNSLMVEYPENKIGEINAFEY